MSGFLTALLDRSAGPLPVLERRPRALFEPAPGQPSGVASGFVETADSGSAAQGDASTSPAESMPEAGRGPQSDNGWDVRSPTPASRHPERSGAAQEGTEHRPKSPQVTATLSGPLAPPAPARPMPDMRVHSAPAVPRQEGRQQTRPASAAVGSQTGSRDASDPADSVAGATAAPADRARFAAIAKPVPPRDHLTEIPAAPTSVPGLPAYRPDLAATGTLSRLHADAAVPARHGAHDALGSRRQSSPATPPAAVAPSVHISIGRVEVRVTSTAPPAARATGPAAPQLSLEDYLRRRHGGRR